ncbi:hypothetical protein MJ1_0435 [Nanobdella aerobiophila]|uniref:Uncharacterized protein n=1 Tax=Nanobdella aerobiophila TaxID=2586965 RepID=A0A915WS66_9ARCH|nr:hypothetical protein [Nanobdella aerobiophila]BBL45596.1 hypothetical protein MJ1_0435 [Nanobdella aerobiophila]
MIVFSALVISSSIFYRLFFYPVYTFNFPFIANITQNNTEVIDYYQLNISGYDLFLISINGILNNNRYIDFSDGNQSISFIKQIDYYIENDSIVRYNYELYENKVDILYPKYSFILCLNHSCAAYTFTNVGIINIPPDYLNNINDTLTIYMSNNIEQQILYDLKYKNKNLINIIKYGLETGNIKVYNVQDITNIIINLYSNNSSISTSQMGS